MHGYPQLSFWILITLVKICFSCILSKPHKNTFELVGTIFNSVEILKCCIVQALNVCKNVFLPCIYKEGCHSCLGPPKTMQLVAYMQVLWKEPSKYKPKPIASQRFQCPHSYMYFCMEAVQFNFTVNKTSFCSITVTLFSHRETWVFKDIMLSQICFQVAILYPYPTSREKWATPKKKKNNLQSFQRATREILQKTTGFPVNNKALSSVDHKNSFSYSTYDTPQKQKKEFPLEEESFNLVTLRWPLWHQVKNWEY